MKKLFLILLIFFIGSCSTKPEEGSVSPEEIAAIASSVKDAGLLIARGADLINFEIASDGTYTDSKNVLYTIIDFIDENTIMVTSIDYGSQKHALTDKSYGATFQKIAFTPASP